MPADVSVKGGLLTGTCSQRLEIDPDSKEDDFGGNAPPLPV
jgi:hypothetical protein